MTLVGIDSRTDVRIATSLSLAAEGMQRDDAVTASRREMKFAFAEAEICRLHTVLESNAIPIRFGAGPVSQVNSIYFDDDRLSSCRESIDGVSRRTKVRLRWYDQPLAQGLMYFEIKHRRGYNVTKQRVPLRLDVPLASLTYPELADHLLGILDDEHGFWLRRRHEAVALVSYKRRHFRDPLSGVRLTLDWDLVSYDQLGLARPARQFPREIRAMTLVEAKASGADEARVRALLYPLRPRLTRNSKYIQCCLGMGWRTIQD